MLVRMCGKKNLHTLQVGMQISTTIENIMEALQKTKNRAAILSSNTTSRDIPEGV
jgi:hypothetical protein